MLCCDCVKRWARKMGCIVAMLRFEISRFTKDYAGVGRKWSVEGREKGDVEVLRRVESDERCFAWFSRW